MLFNSYAFLLVFLPLTLTGYAALTHKSPLAATTFLSMASLAFYGWSSPLAHSVVLLLSMAWNYQIGEAIAGSSTAAARRACLVAGVGVDLLALGCFKYAGFVMAEIGATGWFSDVALPLGISFFTFTQIAYLVF